MERLVGDLSSPKSGFVGWRETVGAWRWTLHVGVSPVSCDLCDCYALLCSSAHFCARPCLSFVRALSVFSFCSTQWRFHRMEWAETSESTRLASLVWHLLKSSQVRAAAQLWVSSDIQWGTRWNVPSCGHCGWCDTWCSQVWAWHPAMNSLGRTCCVQINS